MTQEDPWVTEARRDRRIRQWTWRFIFGFAGFGAAALLTALVRLFITALRP